MFLRLAQAGLPEGVTLQVLEHEKAHTEIRYAPDNDLKDLKTQLEEVGLVRKKKKKKGYGEKAERKA